MTMGSRNSISSVNEDQESSSDGEPTYTFIQYMLRSSQVDRIECLNSRQSDESGDEQEARPSIAKMADSARKSKAIDASAIDVATGGLESSWNLTLTSSVLESIRKREIGQCGFTLQEKCQLGSRYLPNTGKDIARYGHKVFCGRFSSDGNLFHTACQDRKIRLYDSKFDDFRLKKEVQARDVGWSVLDTAFSPSGRHLAYSSWSEAIHMCNVESEEDDHEALHLHPYQQRFCLFALMFSLDGHEIIGGANDGCIYVYDLAKKTRTLRIDAHEDDVNAVVFADSTSQILFSGGDDGFCRVWDRRTLNENNSKAVGVFAGHRNGITYIDSRGDGRHLITNSKDQSIKLWDMRVFSKEEGLESTRKAVSTQNWDYRWQGVPKKLDIRKKKLDGDVSVMTYAGHRVLQTLVRCHFSPQFTTGQKYIYTGCGRGRCIVYDVLTGEIVSGLVGHRDCVRDVSWHPYRNQITTASWDGTVKSWEYECHTDRYDRQTGDNSEDDGPILRGFSLRCPNRLRRAFAEYEPSTSDDR